MSDEELLQFMEEDGGAQTYTAKSFIADVSTNHGSGANTGIRQFNFLLGGSLLLLVTADQAATGGTATAAATVRADAFDTDKSLIGGFIGTSWATGRSTNSRLWVTFTTPIVFDAMEVANFHNTGGLTNIGSNATKLQITEDTGTPSNAFGAAVTGGVTIYDDVFKIHSSVNEADLETLALIP